MTLVGFLGQRFRQILIYFLSFMHQGHMGFIAISESTHCSMKNNFYFYPKFFAGLGIVRQIMEKLGLDPSLSPIRAQTLAKKI